MTMPWKSNITEERDWRDVTTLGNACFLVDPGF